MKDFKRKLLQQEILKHLEKRYIDVFRYRIQLRSHVNINELCRLVKQPIDIVRDNCYELAARNFVTPRFFSTEDISKLDNEGWTLEDSGWTAFRSRILINEYHTSRKLYYDTILSKLKAKLFGGFLHLVSAVLYHYS